jgi:hypothetical protein
VLRVRACVRARGRLACRYRQQLRAMTAEKQVLEHRHTELQQEAAELDWEEQRYWHDFNAFTMLRQV